jgi:hypothetical protein
MQDIQQEIQSLNALLENAKRKLEIFKEFRNLSEESKRTNARIFVTPEEASQIIGCQPSLLDNQRHKKNGPPFFKIRGRIAYDLIDILDYIDACKRHFTSE